MKMQLAFETAAKKLLEQGALSESDLAGGCAYRGESGRKCAIGWLIPDRKYRKSIEGSAATDVNVLRSISATYKVSVDRHEDTIFLGQLQTVHDELPPEDWREGFRLLAQDFELDVSFLEEFHHD